MSEPSYNVTEDRFESQGYDRLDSEFLTALRLDRAAAHQALHSYRMPDEEEDFRYEFAPQGGGLGRVHLLAILGELQDEISRIRFLTERVIALLTEEGRA